MPTHYDALLVVSFGGPDRSGDVLPFLENVLRGRNVPRQRMREVAEHYHQFGGRSPINDQNRALIAALEKELGEHGPRLPIYWGNRNWHPLLPDTLRQMAADGVGRALAFVTSPYSSYSSCRQYLENIAAAQQDVAAGGPPAIGQRASRLCPPQIDKLRAFFNHPGFIEPMIDHTHAALEKVPVERRQNAELIFTAHSIPAAMAAGCRYEAQLHEACRLVAEGLRDSLSLRERARVRVPWTLVYQSRSGPPQQRWLEPAINDFITSLRKGSGLIFESGLSVSANDQSKMRPDPVRDVVVVPIGFISDHMEVVYDLDTEVRQLCDRLGINMVRAATVGTHPRFVQMIRELIEERMSDAHERLALGSLGPSHDSCPIDCCMIVPNRPSLET